ncbi:MAG: hypothetical protein WBP79_16505 [Candidatus Acidiferrales bacterium]
MKKCVLVSVFVFSAFALLGPLIWTICPPGVRNGYGRLDQQVFGLIILTFPTILFSAGKPTPALVGLVEGNIAFFAVIGTLAGLFARRVTSTVIMYLSMCVLLAGLEGYYVGFHLSDFQWPVFGAALVLYAIPFGAVFRYRNRGPNT